MAAYGPFRSLSHFSAISARYDILVKPISRRMQFGLVGMGYAAVLVVAAAAALFRQHLVELQDPAAASGGMAAAGAHNALSPHRLLYS